MAKRVIFPHAPAYGGPGSFQRAFEEQLSRLGINTEYYPQNAAKNDTVLIVNGTKKIFWLLKQKYFYRSKIILRLGRKSKSSNNGCKITDSHYKNYFNKDL